MDATVKHNIDVFFQDPGTEPVIPGTVGVLYLLRRDIIHCLRNGIILFPATMATLAGIDLLAKFYARNDKTREAGQRFIDFVSRYFPLTGDDDDDAVVIYQFRNALLHSFGLYSRTKNKTYRFNIGKTAKLIGRGESDLYFIDPWILYRDLETAIQQYRDSLRNDQDLQANFQAMFPMYGTIYVSNGPVP
jgi:hypothetical protein